MLAFTAALAYVTQSPYTEEEYWKMWQEFQQLEGTTMYATQDEHDQRFEIFKDNMDYAHAENTSGRNTHTLGITKFADWTQKEFGAWLQKTSGFKPPKDSLRVPRKLFDPTGVEAPASADWVSEGYVTPVKDQGQCGSCWAFSTTGGVEGANFKKHGTLSSFSEQELVDCSHDGGNAGCNGGLMDDGFKYVEDNGLCFETAYPYEGTDGTCRKSKCDKKVTVTGWTDVEEGDYEALKTACGANGPISVAVDAGITWQMYNGGVLSMCRKSPLDHGVLLVGYSGDDYFKIKNSWGASWGENGYIRIKGGANTCGLASSASWPTVA